jgi:hypothetical protein
MPCQGEHEGNGVLGGGNGITGWCVHHYDALAGSFRNIDVIDAHAGPGDDLEFFTGLNNVFGDFGLAAHQQ